MKLINLKHVILLFTILISSLSIASDNFIEFKKSMYYSCSDTLGAYDTAILSTVFKNIGLENAGERHPSYKLAYINKKLRWFIGYFEFKYDPEYLHPKLSELKLKCSYRDSLIIEGFRIYPSDKKRNSLKFILSAYQQEFNPEIKKNDSLYIVLPIKTESELMKCNWISPAYAMHYLQDQNPFSNLGIGLQVCYYLMDAFGLAYVIGGPIFGKDLTQKIGYPVLGLAFLTEIRFLAGIALKMGLKNYNTIRNSPYRVPVSVEF